MMYIGVIGRENNNRIVFNKEVMKYSKFYLDNILGGDGSPGFRLLGQWKPINESLFENRSNRIEQKLINITNSKKNNISQKHF